MSLDVRDVAAVIAAVLAPGAGRTDISCRDITWTGTSCSLPLRDVAGRRFPHLILPGPVLVPRPGRSAPSTAGCRSDGTTRLTAKALRLCAGTPGSTTPPPEPNSALSPPRSGRPSLTRSAGWSSPAGSAPRRAPTTRTGLSLRTPTRHHVEPAGSRSTIA